jgi:esterase/lipase superfamily enzyme
VHGFYTTFRRAAQDALALQKTLRFTGPVIVYSQPSKVTSRLAYINDDNNAVWSSVHFREFLSALLDAYGDCPSRSLHIA